LALCIAVEFHNLGAPQTLTVLGPRQTRVLTKRNTSDCLLLLNLKREFALKQLLLGLLLTFTTATFADEYVSKSCDDSDFLNGAWQELTQKEPLIAKLLKEIGERSGVQGSIIPVTNCVVKWPVDKEGNSVSGLRMAIIDKVWKDKQGVIAHGGMKILYTLRSSRVEYIDGSVGTTKERFVKGLVICRGPDVCEMLDIPFKKSEKPPSTKSDTKLPLEPAPVKGTDPQTKD